MSNPADAAVARDGWSRLAAIREMPDIDAGRLRRYRLERIREQMQPGMVICIESYVGRRGGTCGVKLEEQVLVTEDGTEVLNTFPFEDRLLGT